MIHSVAVYLGSAKGSKKYMDFAFAFGKTLAENHIKVVFGGADVGTMRALADGVLSAGGEIVGVFPVGFGGKREIAATHKDIRSKDLSDNIPVKDLAERKEKMIEMTDCCIILPGGFGTMDELFCHAVGNEVGLHDKKAYVMNVFSYYDGLEQQLGTMSREGFLPSGPSVIEFLHSPEEFISLARSL